MPGRRMAVTVRVPAMGMHMRVLAAGLMARLATSEAARGRKERQQAQQKQASSQGHGFQHTPRSDIAKADADFPHPTVR